MKQAQYNNFEESKKNKQLDLEQEYLNLEQLEEEYHEKVIMIKAISESLKFTDQDLEDMLDSNTDAFTEIKKLIEKLKELNLEVKKTLKRISILDGSYSIPDEEMDTLFEDLANKEYADSHKGMTKVYFGTSNSFQWKDL